MKESEIIEKLLILKNYFDSDPKKFVSSSVIGFDSAKRDDSMSILKELLESSFIEIQSITQVPKIRLTEKGNIKAQDSVSEA